MILYPAILTVEFKLDWSFIKEKSGRFVSCIYFRYVAMGHSKLPGGKWYWLLKVTDFSYTLKVVHTLKYLAF